jgi:hypothetical protein
MIGFSPIHIPHLLMLLLRLKLIYIYLSILIAYFQRKKVDDLITTLDENVKTPLTRKNIPPDDSFYNDEDDLAWAQIIQNRC